MVRRVLLLVAVVGILLVSALAENDYGLKPGFTEKVEAFEKWYKGAFPLGCSARREVPNGYI